MKIKSPFVETLGAALDAINEYLHENDVVLVDEIGWLDPFTFSGISYETFKEAHGEIATIKGAKTKKYAHATIWRMSSGRYEWNVYIL